MEKEKNQCPEFPFFGANYPDATCIDGYLWDLDKYEDGYLYSTGDDHPCPFCNTEEFIKQNMDADSCIEVYNSQESILKWIENLRERYGLQS